LIKETKLPNYSFTLKIRAKSARHNPTDKLTTVHIPDEITAGMSTFTYAVKVGNVVQKTPTSPTSECL
jgi:hypothetical protein